MLAYASHHPVVLGMFTVAPLDQHSAPLQKTCKYRLLLEELPLPLHSTKNSK